MSIFSRLGRGGHLPPAPPPLSADDVIAEAEHRAGYDRTKKEEVRDYSGALVAHGWHISVLRDLIAVELLPSSGMVGLLFMTDVTKSTRNQQFHRARIVSVGPKALGMNGVLLHEEVLVSEYFGQEVRLLQPDGNERTVKVGRIRDTVGVFRPDGLLPRTNRVLMERMPRDMQVGRILLPEDMLELQIKCRVIAAGPECSVKAGDRVLVTKDSFVKVVHGATDLLLLDEPSILCVL